jgi:hypothetical protein
MARMSKSNGNCRSNMSESELSHILAAKWHSVDVSHDGRTVTVHFYHGMDRELASVDCQETDSEVRIVVLLGLRRLPDGVVVPAMLMGGSAVVTLREPILERAIIDGSSDS